MQKKLLIHSYCRQFKMGGLSAGLDQMLIEAETNSISYIEYTINLFQAEALHREYNDAQKRLKVARLPRFHDLNSYDHTFENGLSKTRPDSAAPYASRYNPSACRMKTANPVPAEYSGLRRPRPPNF